MKSFKKRYFLDFTFLLLLLLAVFILALFFVPKPLDFAKDKEASLYIIKNIRAPQVLIAVVAGFSLSLTGSLMQTVLDNPLSSPFTLGLSSASCFGASVAIVLSYNTCFAFLLPATFSFLASCVCAFLLLLLSGLSCMSKKNIILVGMALSFLFSSLNTLLEYYASPEVVYQISSWQAGTVARATIKECIILFFASFLCLIVAFLLACDMQIIMQGQRVAVMQGVNVKAIRGCVLVLCSFLASYTVSIVGIIGFVGLVAPHFARLLKFQKLKVFFFASSFIGSILVVFAYAVSSSLLYPVTLPIGAVLSLLGIPFLLFLVFSSKT